MPERKDVAIKEAVCLDILTLEQFIRNVDHEYETTHKVVCFAVIQRIYRRILAGYRFGSIKVNNGKLVVDGNHRYIAYKLAGIVVDKVKSGRSFSDIGRSFNHIKIDVNEDWDRNCPYHRKYCNDDFLSEFE
ncbi:hypothetical protein [Flavobacterium cerinum]|uniref:ParB/Sulfiredoxin domain-containing protein n=1 Tax=Flavobacterium cerinum TaxID=2502784 RepID=A0ABY5IPU8_9FLAO|nr:hypothetical protein [Flavobacterium cerinum]UUC44862.1 hypothetical protein NOX80_14650 [Flavobacterium cerinum]